MFPGDVWVYGIVYLCGGDTACATIGRRSVHEAFQSVRCTVKRFIAGLFVAALSCAGVANAKLEMTSGIQYAIPNAPISDCNTKAENALNTYLSNVSEVTPNSNVWEAYGPKNATENTASAVIRCNPYQKGYVVRFICAIQTPPNPYTAEILCLDIAHAFSGQKVYPLPTPTPVPSGCTTTNLVGTWINDNNPTNVLKMGIHGSITDQDGVSGNWALNGNKASLSYYGLHTLTLSPDGKRLSGDLHLTRKC